MRNDRDHASRNRLHRPGTGLVLVLAGLTAACSKDREVLGGTAGSSAGSGSGGEAGGPADSGDGSGSGDDGPGAEAGSSSGGEAGSSSDGEAGSSSGGEADSGDEGIRFDIGTVPDLGGGGSESGGGMDCEIPHAPCDEATADPFTAMGLNCPGEIQVTSSTTGDPRGIGVRTRFGATATFDPREGKSYAVIGSGFVAELDSQPPNGDEWELDFPTYCDDDHDGLPSNTELGPRDPDGTLPLPIRPNAVGGDCLSDPTLLHTGDCSNTIQAQWDQGASARDYVELRFSLVVPPNVNSLSYDFAFATTEHPNYHGSQYNDIYVGWLESEAWTGNISFDAAGKPISLNAAFLEFKDDGSLPELDGTCMKWHAATNWLTSTAPVKPGETITVVFAIMDLADSILDSYVLLDNFRWGCTSGGRPETVPVG